MTWGVTWSWTRWKRPLPSATVEQVAPVPLRLGVGVAGELERGVREDGADPQGRPRQEGLDLRRRDVGACQGLEASVGADREVAQEARAGDGVVDLRLGAPAGPVLREGGGELWESSSVRG